MAEDDSETGVGVISDRSTKFDTIGFEQYTEALRTLLLHPSTESPLTVSIEGSWGSGKSSFMKQLRKKLDNDGYITVDFNPWRHENKESLWATFIQKFVSEIVSSNSKNAISRLIARNRLILGRLSRLSSIKIVFTTFISIISISIIVISMAILLIDPPILSQQNPRVRLFIGTSGIFVGLWAMWKVVRQAVYGITIPLRRQLGNMYISTEYPDKQSSLGEIDEDLDDLIDAYAGEDPIFVFIDDLDRCDPGKAAELMRATNVLLEKRPQLILIIGMDREKVAAGLAAEHNDVLPYLQSDSENQPTDGMSDMELQSQEGLEFGYRYLEKFIQLPFRVPQAKEEELGTLLMPPEDQYRRKATYAETDIDDYLETRIFNNQSELLNEITEMVTPFFEYNPRQIKKFGNVYRLQSILASQESILAQNTDGESDVGVTLEQLAKFVAISVQCPRLASLLQNDPQSIQDLETYAVENDIDLDDLPPRLRPWTTNHSLLELLRYRAEDPESAYSFQSVSLEQLVQISSTVEERRGTEQIDPELLSDDERVVELIRQNDGRMRQIDIAEETGWGEDKTSQLMSKMEEDDQISRLRIGREYLITLPETEIGGSSTTTD